MNSVSARLTTLENENKARKASFPVATALVKFTVQTSQDFTITSDGSGNSLYVRIKFTPSQGREQANLISLYPLVAVDDPLFAGVLYPYIEYLTEPQDRSGAVAIRLKIQTGYTATTFHIRIVASGISSGTFTQTLS